MARRQTRKKAEGWKAKKWYDVVTPEIFGKMSIGSTPADDPAKLIGRIMDTTLGELTNDLGKQNVKMHFKVNEVSGESAHTRFTGHELTRDYLRSLVKRRTSLVESNIIVTTKDGFKVHLKPMSLTIKRAGSSQIKAIRDIMNGTLRERANDLDYEQFIHEVVLGKLASDIYKKSKIIYPLRRVEISKTKILAEP
ncbi:MAG: 30S ribosomal protein S3ae [Euryarchaeota archaeon]|nr:30S ribosomal protein S3ae [Euryarchaeota archaeon]